MWVTQEMMKGVFMIIKSIYIKQFRGFKDVSFDLGTNITVLAGQNGTQKTTVLGLLSQPFSLSKGSLMYGEKPLCGMNYRSLFKQKFKLSEVFDKPGSHEWTLKLTDPEETEFTIDSIKRDKAGEIRFWQKGKRSKGSGYIQLPVIYLSLSRLQPIGEDAKLESSSRICLTPEESKLLEKWHNKILIIPNIEMKSIDYLESTKKNTLGFNTSVYDWRMNSAGQDNLSKILLAILSFKRLQEQYPNDYKGGILAIDELDATMYPASQLKLIEFLLKYSAKYKIQVVFTTHSLALIEKAYEIQNNGKRRGQVKVIYLYREDLLIKVKENESFAFIKNKLNVTMPGISSLGRKLYAFREDQEAESFLKCIMKYKAMANFVTQSVNLGSGNYIQLAEKKIPGFRPCDSVIFLDGDVINNAAESKKIKRIPNIFILPGGDSPERLLASFLLAPHVPPIEWDKIAPGYDIQVCFKNFQREEIMENRDSAKAWFQEQKVYWGRNGARLINLWIKENQKAVDDFRSKVNEYIAKNT
jgi:AAA15 family ATPase/GTPase